MIAYQKELFVENLKKHGKIDFKMVYRCIYIKIKSKKLNTGRAGQQILCFRRNHSVENTYNAHVQVFSNRLVDSRKCAAKKFITAPTNA